MSASFGVVLDPWQEDVLRAAMGERTDGRWATSQVGLSTPRQNGKSQLIVARALAGIMLFGEKTIICSAHQQDTAREVFNRLVDICEEYPALDSRVEQYGKALNREYIRFKSGQVIRFKARSSGGGRGFSCDCLLLDEAQILGSSAWSAILPTMSARPNPQAWLLGTPPTPEDDGEVFTRLRSAALGGKAAHLAWLEWGADAEDDLDDLATWAKANPAYPSRISTDAIAGERASMSDDQFRLERLGMWVGDTMGSRLIGKTQWSELGVDTPPDGVKSFGVAFSFDGSRVAVAGAMKHDDGVHVELVGLHSGQIGAGVAALADWLAEPSRVKATAEIVICGKAGAGVLLAALTARGVPTRMVRILTAPEYFTANAMLVDAVHEGSLSHLATEGQKALDDSVAVSDKKVRGLDGAWGWVATTPGGDETPTEAISLAHFAAKTTKRRPGRTTKGRVMS